MCTYAHINMAFAGDITIATVDLQDTGACLTSPFSASVLVCISKQESCGFGDFSGNFQILSHPHANCAKMIDR